MDFKLSIKLNSLPGFKRFKDENGRTFVGIDEEACGVVFRNSVYLNLVAWESKQSFYGDTHYLKLDWPMEHKHDADPIIGNIRPIVVKGKVEKCETFDDVQVGKEV